MRTSQIKFDFFQFLTFFTYFETHGFILGLTVGKSTFCMVCFTCIDVSSVAFGTVCTALYLERYVEARFLNHCCCGKAINMTYS